MFSVDSGNVTGNFHVKVTWCLFKHETLFLASLCSYIYCCTAPQGAAVSKPCIKPLQQHWIHLQLKAGGLPSIPPLYVQIYLWSGVPCVPRSNLTSAIKLSVLLSSSPSQVAGKWDNLLPHHPLSLDWWNSSPPITAFRPPPCQLPVRPTYFSLSLSFPLCLSPSTPI